MLPIASRMSSTRSRQSLGGNHRLAQNLVAKLGLERGGCHEIDAVSDDIGKRSLQANELEQADRAAELHEQIHVTIVSAFVASERAEQRQARDTERVEGRPSSLQCL